MQPNSIGALRGAGSHRSGSGRGLLTVARTVRGPRGRNHLNELPARGSAGRKQPGAPAAVGPRNAGNACATSRSIDGSRAPTRKNDNEAHVDQRDSAGGVACRDRGRAEPVRPRHRNPLEGAEESQHLQGPHHPRRTLAGSLFRRLRCRSPRLPAAQGSVPAVLHAWHQPEQGHDPRTPEGRPGDHGPGREGGTRQQGRRADHLHQPRGPLHGADAEQPEGGRRVAPHRRRRPADHQGSARPPRSARGHGPDRAHRRPRPRRRRTAVGPRLPAATVEGDLRSRAGAPGRVPDLPGIQAHHPRAARLPAQRHRRDPDRPRGTLRGRARVRAAGDAEQPAQAQALPGHHAAVLALPDRNADRERVRTPGAPAFGRLDRDRPDRSADRDRHQLGQGHARQRHRGNRVQHELRGRGGNRAPVAHPRCRRPHRDRLHRHGFATPPARGRRQAQGRAQARSRARAGGSHLALRPARDVAPAPAAEPRRSDADRVPALRRPRPHPRRRIAVVVRAAPGRGARDEGQHRPGAGAGALERGELPAQREAPPAHRDRSAPRRQRDRGRRREPRNAPPRNPAPARRRHRRGDATELPAHDAGRGDATADDAAPERRTRAACGRGRGARDARTGTPRNRDGRRGAGGRAGCRCGRRPARTLHGMVPRSAGDADRGTRSARATCAGCTGAHDRILASFRPGSWRAVPATRTRGRWPAAEWARRRARRRSPRSTRGIRAPGSVAETGARARSPS